jgi:hypothetical protein
MGSGTEERCAAILAKTVALGDFNPFNLELIQ